MKNIFCFMTCITMIFILACGNMNKAALPSTAYDIADKIVEMALTEEAGYKWLEEVSEIGPRLSGSENSMKSILWAEAKMKELGFDRVELQPAKVPFWERGNLEKATLLTSSGIKVKELSIATLGGSIGTNGKALRAEVLEVKSFEELEAKKDQAKGKIVFYNHPMKKSFVKTFEGYGDAVAYRWQGAMSAAQLGAVGVIIRSVTTREDNVPHTGVMGYDDSIVKIPAVALGLIDTDFLSESLAKDPTMQIELNLNPVTHPDADSYNVIGEITGSEFPDEIIVVSGHWDSWDKGTGMHDDAGGCIQAMEVLDLFNRLGIKPKRTIRAVFFINEENGSGGSVAYAEAAEAKGENHLAAIESDRGVFTPRGFSTDAAEPILQKMRAWVPVLRKASIEWINPGGSGADVSKIKGAKALIGYVPDGQRYFDFHHAANDVYEAVNPREMQLGTAAQAILVYMLSEFGL